MSKINFDAANKMRAGGMTYEAIAKYFGVTKQYVKQYMDNPAFDTKRRRKNSVLYNNISYYGFKKMFEEDDTLTVPKVASAIFGYTTTNSTNKISRLMTGKQTALTIEALNNLLAFSGLSYETFFKRIK